MSRRGLPFFSAGLTRRWREAGARREAARDLELIEPREIEAALERIAAEGGTVAKKNGGGSACLRCGDPGVPKPAKDGDGVVWKLELCGRCLAALLLEALRDKIGA